LEMIMAVEPDSAGVRFPPPFVYLGALLLGLAAERFVTLRSFGIDWRLLVATGALLFVAGTAMMISAAGLFRRLGTNVPPSQPTTLIATTGPYRWTRNPMYLGMALVYAGLAIAGDRPRGALSRSEVRRRLPPLQGRGSPLALTIPPLPPAGLLINQHRLPCRERLVNASALFRRWTMSPTAGAPEARS
jgi:protein-S-isoprenylcysteine O-methyltransferase Ste14